MTYSERTQVLLSREQRAKVAHLAASSSTSVGAVIRDAIDAYTAPPSPEQRQQALDDLFSLEASVDEWEVIEQQIADGYTSS